jgi:hypothetical protein
MLMFGACQPVPKPGPTKEVRIRIRPDMDLDPQQCLEVLCLFSSLQNFLKLSTTEKQYLKGQSHEKVGEMSVWGISLGPN